MTAPVADGLREARRLVEAATGPDRAVEFALFRLFNPEYAGPEWQPFGSGLRHVNDSSDMRCLPPPEATPGRYTASIDAALGLVERVLPGSDVIMGFGQTARTLPWCRVGEWRGVDAARPTLPLAILSALLFALAEAAPGQETLCEGCPPVGYPTDNTRCLPCPRRADAGQEGGA